MVSLLLPMLFFAALILVPQGLADFNFVPKYKSRISVRKSSILNPEISKTLNLEDINGPNYNLNNWKNIWIPKIKQKPATKIPQLPHQPIPKRTKQGPIIPKPTSPPEPTSPQM
uniref:Early nodulin-10-like n=1 Tax=Cicer arietinum TaxID=3827 RepID=A0A1S2Z1E2_CICAR|nr:early nodulin-10-like [Cicer arietinum]